MSPTVKGFLALAIQLATKKEALGADTFDEVAAFNNCFCSLCSLFFSFEKIQRLFFQCRVLDLPCGEAVFKVS